MATANIKYVRKYETRRGKRTMFNVKLKMHSEAYGKIMEDGKLNIGYERCRVYDETEIVQCMKCLEYNHLARDCKNQENTSKMLWSAQNSKLQKTRENNEIY